MRILRTAAFLALGWVLSAPFAGAVETNTEWWKVDFENDPETGATPEGFDELGQAAGGVTFVDGIVGPLTNSYVDLGGGLYHKAPYASGNWTMADGDESYVTNSMVTNVLENTSGASMHLKLDTQGNDLTWTPSNAAVKVITLVDADIFFVGSDSEPDQADFDPASETDRVQAAIYLKNEVDDGPNGTGNTTNSVLCLYARAPGDEGGSTWYELDGNVEIDDNTWHHVQVVVNYKGTRPSVTVFVDGEQMHVRGGETASWTVANAGTANALAGKVGSVSFRGTGEVDNFVGTSREVTLDTLTFGALVYTNNVLVEVGSSGNFTRYKDWEAGLPGSDERVEFKGFTVDEWDPVTDDPIYALSKIVWTDFVNNAEKTITYVYNENTGRVSPSEASDLITINASGTYVLNAVTDGATQPTNVAVRIYYRDIGAYDAMVSETIGGTTTTNGVTVKPSDFEGGATKTLEWEFPATKDGSVLQSIRVSNGADVNYANRKATVSVTLTEELSADTVFADAVYAPGTLADGQDLKPTRTGDTVTFEPWVPPVAIRVSADGTATNECSSLREAIEDYAQNGDTVYLVADDRVSFTAENPELAIGFEVTIDGGSNTLYGVSNYAPPSNGSADHDIYIGGSAAVTVKNLTLSGFSDSVPTAQRRTNPIWVGKGYTGTLTLDGVTVTNFNRTAFNLGGGTVVVTNCVVGGCYDHEMEGEDCFQSAIEVFNASVTVAETKVTGVGSTMTKEDSQIASCFTMQSDTSTTPWTGGTGSIRILSGSYAGEYIGLAMELSEGSILVEGGTFVAAAPADDEAFGRTGEDPVSSITIIGGWFDRPPTNFVAEGLSVRKLKDDFDPAPWTVGQVFEIAFWTGDELDGAPAFWSTNAFTGETGYGPTNAPTKDATAQYTYAFAGWTNATSGAFVADAADLPAVDGAATWNAVWTETVNTFLVVFNDEDGSKLAETNAPYGDTGYGPADPTKAATAQYTYAFAGWTNATSGAFVETADLPAVTEAATWKAVYTATVNTFLVEFYDEDGTTKLAETNAPYGDTGYGPADPTKAATAQYTYAFAGWTNATSGAFVETADLPAVTEAATWKAVYTESAREYVIVWVVEGVETTNKVAYGQNPAWTGTEPSKEGYTFLGWNSDPTATTALATPLPAVTGDAFYYAVFEENQAVEPDPVDSAQVAIDSTGFKVTFVSKQAGIFYQLVAADACDLTDEQWKGDATSGNAEPVAGATATSAADTSEQNPQTITLTAPMSASDTKKFYKIKASIPSGN